MYRHISALIFISIFVSVSSCSDNPVGTDGDDHGEVWGAVLSRNSQEIVRATGGVISGNPGSISLGVGEAVVVSVQWLDDDGDEVHDEDLKDDEYTLIVREHDREVVDIEMIEGSRWSFRATGLSEGGTSIRIVLDHNGHDDFITPLITVQVSEQQTQP